MRTFTLALPPIVPVSFAIELGRRRTTRIRHCSKLQGRRSAYGYREPLVLHERRKRAKDQLAKNWSRFSASQKRACVKESTAGGDQSYVELLTCLEMSGGGQFSPKQ
jgi:hypothetical protein